MVDGGARQGLDLEGRDGKIWRGITIYRRTQSDLAKEFGISQQRVGQIYEEVKASIPAHDLDVMRRESLELYAELGRRALEIVDLVPAPIFVGKDGSIAYDDKGEVVRDYTGRLRAMETAAKFDAERRKLMGLDAAQKAEVSGNVTYQIVGVDPADLS
jgi:hypothetical protein